MKNRSMAKRNKRWKANPFLVREGETTRAKENVELRLPSWVVPVEEPWAEGVEGKWGCLRVRLFKKEGSLSRWEGENLGQRTVLCIGRQVADRAHTISLREKGWPACGSGGLKRFLR
jgi:hypothetical protein